MAVLEAVDEAAAVEHLHRIEATDGLPVIVPTPERVARMALMSGLDAELVLGEMGPMRGAATIERLAACAVMAGCLPDHMPVVVAAARAVMAPEFDLTEMQATTYGTSPLVLVNGPIREWCDIAHGSGALGPGFRANATIGRALRLAMINIGGGRAGSADMALLGHGGKFTACLAEDEVQCPWEPLHVSRGFDVGDSVVTVIGTESPSQAIWVGDADDPSATERWLDTVAGMFLAPGTNNAVLRGGAAVVVINPDHADALAAAGYRRDTIAEALVERTTRTLGQFRAANPSFVAPGPDDRELAVFDDPADVLLVVAGGRGLYSFVFPTWCAGPNTNRAVSVPVELDAACEVPSVVAATQRG